MMLSVGTGQGWGCRQVKGVVRENRAERMLLHMHVLYEDLIDDPSSLNYMSILIMKMRNFKRFCIQW